MAPKVSANTDTVRNAGNELLGHLDTGTTLMNDINAMIQKFTVDGTVDGELMPSATATQQKLVKAVQAARTGVNTIQGNLRTLGTALTGEADGLDQIHQDGADRTKKIPGGTSDGAGPTKSNEGTGGTQNGDGSGTDRGQTTPNPNAHVEPPQTDDSQQGNEGTTPTTTGPTYTT